MKVNFAYAAVAAALFAANVWAETPPPQPDPSAAPPPAGQTEAPKEDPTVCKKFKTTGSRLPTEKICKKQSEWDAEAEANSEATKRELDRQNSKQ
jgi:hypothetical protein